jgi:sterol desaturase/sphingolipid hydroxylase (fatty acid hydroxylase superfamily)
MAFWNAVVAAWAAMPPWAQEVARYANGLVLLALIFLPLEALFSPRSGSRSSRRWSVRARDVGYYFLSSLLPNKALAIAVAAFFWAWQAIAPQGLAPALGTLPWPMRLAMALLVAELGAYGAHRALHAWPRLWRFHALHHAATEMHWLVNTRAHPVDLVFTRFCALMPLYLLGLVPPAGGPVDPLPLLVALATCLWGYVIHANLRWRFGWLEGIVSTPAFHHHHHRDVGAGGFNHANFAPLLAYVDRLFGTYEAPQHWPERYGSQDEVGLTMVDQIMLPFMPALPAPPAAVDRPPDPGASH